eukprot:366474-Chlamydomonas_euryale.AAC.28
MKNTSFPQCEYSTPGSQGRSSPPRTLLRVHRRPRAGRCRRRRHVECFRRPAHRGASAREGRLPAGSLWRVQEGIWTWQAAFLLGCHGCVHMAAPHAACHHWHACLAAVAHAHLAVLHAARHRSHAWLGCSGTCTAGHAAFSTSSAWHMHSWSRRIQHVVSSIGLAAVAHAHLAVLHAARHRSHAWLGCSGTCTAGHAAFSTSLAVLVWLPSALLSQKSDVKGGAACGEIVGSPEYLHRHASTCVGSRESQPCTCTAMHLLALMHPVSWLSPLPALLSESMCITYMSYSLSGSVASWHLPAIQGFAILVATELPWTL